MFIVTEYAALKEMRLFLAHQIGISVVFTHVVR